MKNYFSKIFAVYILILALIPCTDFISHGLCEDTDNIHIENSTESEHEDLCTPMCTCNCCNSIVTLTEQFSLKNYIPHSEILLTEVSQYDDSFSMNTSPPPKS